MPIINKIKMLGHGGYNKYKLCSSINDLKIVNQCFVNDFYNDIKSLMSGRKYCVGFDDNQIIVYSDDLNEGEHETIASIIGSRLKSNINVIVSSYQGLIDLLRSRLTTLLGEGNFELISDNDSQKITIALASTVEHLREQIDSLIERVVPQNLEFEYDNGLPIDFEQVEYLESNGTQRINTNIIPTSKSGFKLALTYIHGQGNDNKTNYMFGCQTRSGGEAFHVHLSNERVGVSLSPTTIFYNKKRLSQLDKFEISVNYKNDSVYYVDGEDAGVFSELNYTPIFYIWLFRSSFKSNTSFDPSYPVRVWSCEMTEGEATIRNYVPALDPTGASCMYDTVSRKTFYNSGTGDFIYPTDAAPAVSADLDEKFYAKLTEHGVRRLYHVPHGYTGSKDQYATENGYKELVEPPMPLEGYWTPEWRETETQLILEWVEAEPINTEEHE